jgi:magnesium-transporting ATPase (P-type)
LSPEPLVQMRSNFTGILLGWSSTKFVQEVLFQQFFYSSQFLYQICLRGAVSAIFLFLTIFVFLYFFPGKCLLKIQHSSQAMVLHLIVDHVAMCSLICKDSFNNCKRYGLKIARTEIFVWLNVLACD